MRVLRGDSWRIHMRRYELAVEVRPLTAQQRAQHRDRFGGASIPGLTGERLAGKIRRNRIDHQSPARNVLQRGDLARKLRHHQFAQTNGKQQFDQIGFHRDG